MDLIVHFTLWDYFTLKKEPEMRKTARKALLDIGLSQNNFISGLK
jgi:hypothetical protein